MKWEAREIGTLSTGIYGELASSFGFANNLIFQIIPQKLTIYSKLCFFEVYHS
jgi:hypothetical protein